MTWQFDKAHTRIEFSAKHMMVTTVKGSFKLFDGEIDLNEADHSASSVSFAIDAASLDTGVEQRDGHLRSPDFLNVAQYPKITFKSTRIERTSDTTYRVTGDLTIRDVTRPETFTVEQTGQFKTLQGANAYAFEVTGKIVREDFGLNWNVALETGGWLVGKEVKIAIDTEVFAPVAVATA